MVFLIIYLFVIGIPMVQADSIWKEGESISPYTMHRAYKVGDILGLIIMESTSAIQKAGTNTESSDDLSLKFNYALNRSSSSPQSYSQGTARARNKFKGLGKTQRYADVRARLSARVVEVLPRGNLKIVGTHRIEVNNDEQLIVVTGIVRARDISTDNTIYSYQVAQPDIVVKGVGTVQEAETPGWITRILNWVF